MSKYTFNTPVILVGAGRSGTTILKKTLGAHPDFYATEFELNYLWRTGNAHLSHDLLNVTDHYTPKKAQKIRKALFKSLKKSGKPRLVEKTVANIMRLEYIHKTMPEAKIIHIIRDGRAVTASAMKRWRAKPPAGYFMTKMKTLPWYTIPLYGIRYIKSKIIGKCRGQSHGQTWGPRWPNMDAETKNMPLAEICARQWQKSIQAAMAQKQNIPSENYLEIRYEDLLQHTGKTLDQIVTFIGIDNPMPLWNYAKNTIKDQGHDWRHELSVEDQNLIETLLQDDLKRLYPEQEAA